jgi:hypothetical protein
VNRAFFLIMLALGACGDDGGSGMPDANTIDAAIPDAMARETINSMQALQVGQLVEGTMTGGMGDVAVITLTAPTPTMGWNIHGHANGSTQIIFEEHDKATVTYTFAPATHAEWYLLVRNEGQANMEVTVKIELFGAMAWAWL